MSINNVPTATTASSEKAAHASATAKRPTPRKPKSKSKGKSQQAITTKAITSIELLAGEVQLGESNAAA